MRELGTADLCKWLRDNSDLNANKMEEACNAIIAQNIEGADFLEISLDEWIKFVGLGTAKSLVRITQALFEISDSMSLI